MKPDGVQRSLIGEVIQRFEKVGLKLVAMKFIVADEERLWKHYNKDDVWYETKGKRTLEERKASGLSYDRPAIEYGKDIIRHVIKYMTSGPVVAMVWEGNSAVGIIKKLTGTTEPLTSDVGTIRGDLTVDSYDLTTASERAVRNLLHCSDKVEDAKNEIKIWFADNELIKYRQIQEAILYDVNLDGIME